MGEARFDEFASGPSDDLHVLVTGFGPFLGNFTNPSYLVARSLPKSIMVKTASGTDRLVHIHTLPHPVRVSYKYIRDEIPRLLFPPVTGLPRPSFDLVLFIGMAGGRPYYTLEALAHRDGYNKGDVDHNIQTGDDRELWREKYGAPETLEPIFDVGDVHERWEEGLKPADTDVRISHDAGRYCCDFIYYTGLVEYWRRTKAKGPVAFLHTPGETDSKSVMRGSRVAEKLIGALVESHFR